MTHETKHTPGPWRVSKPIPYEKRPGEPQKWLKGSYTVERDTEDHRGSTLSGEICTINGNGGTDEIVSNANLLAASPDLLHSGAELYLACVSFFEHMNAGTQKPEHSKRLNKALDHQYAAIAKARGES